MITLKMAHKTTDKTPSFISDKPIIDTDGAANLERLEMSELWVKASDFFSNELDFILESDESQENGNNMIIAYSNEEPVGLLQATITRLDERSVHIDFNSIYILDIYQGQGIGSKMTQELYRTALNINKKGDIKINITDEREKNSKLKCPNMYQKQAKNFFKEKATGITYNSGDEEIEIEVKKILEYKRVCINESIGLFIFAPIDFSSSSNSNSNKRRKIEHQGQEL